MSILRLVEAPSSRVLDESATKIREPPALTIDFLNAKGVINR